MNRAQFSAMLLKLGQFMLDHGDHPIFDYLKRSKEEQKRLFEAGLSKCDGEVKQSLHQKGRAVDIYLATPDGAHLLEWTEGGKDKLYHDYWVSLGGEPMLSWDVGHFEAK